MLGSGHGHRHFMNPKDDRIAWRAWTSQAALTICALNCCRLASASAMHNTIKHPQHGVPRSFTPDAGGTC